MDDSEKTRCVHEGQGEFCHKCGKSFQPDKHEENPKCQSGHAHMKDKLNREYCTYCGKKLE